LILNGLCDLNLDAIDASLVEAKLGHYDAAFLLHVAHGANAVWDCDQLLLFLCHALIQL